MAKKTKTPQKECDELLQRLGRLLFNSCEVCGRPISCLHHFFPKSTSNRLRYDFLNLIPICNGCHTRHHMAGDPRIHGTIIQKRGLAWYENLLILKQEYVKVDKFWYQKHKEELTQRIKELTGE